MKNRIFFVLIAIVGIACSVNRKNPINVAYHNLTAHYNAYFYAKERLNEIETGLLDKHEWNFNEILPIYPPVDTTDTVTYKEQLFDGLKKGSIAIQRHRGSKYEYPSYNIVGQIQMYNLRYDDAIETFKYVNTKCEKEEIRHEALLHLLRVMTLQGDDKNALSVIDFLKKENLNKKNSSLFHLNQAFFFQHIGDLTLMAKHLILAEKIGHLPQHKLYLLYLIGQATQKLNLYQDAYFYYKKLLKKHPPYNLTFYTKLNLALVANRRDNKRIYSYFDRLVRDRNNDTYLDKIYYAKGIFELRLGKIEKGISNFKKSLSYPSEGRMQKKLSYLMLGVIYYDTLRNFETAKLYYDSTLNQSMQVDPDFKKIESKQKALTEFVVHLNKIGENDSLIALSKIPQDSLLTLIKRQVIQDSIKNNQKKVASISQNTVAPVITKPQQSIISSQNTSWYFDNINVVAKGKKEFDLRWKNRPLTDNWRRRAAQMANIPIEESPIERPLDKSDTTTSVQDTLNTQQLTMQKLDEIQDKIKNIENLENEIALSMYELAKIYHFQLDETPLALETFHRLLNRFPKTSLKPEIYYQLYLIYKAQNDPKSEEYAQNLFSQFPNSLYAHLVRNPNYREETFAITQKLKKTYALAYDLMKKQKLDTSLQIIESALKEHPQNEFSDNLALLKVLNEGKLWGEAVLQMGLNDFLESFPDSDMKEYATELVTQSEKFQSNRFSSSKGKYQMAKTHSPHPIIITFQDDKTQENAILTSLSPLLNTYENLKIRKLLLKKDTRTLKIEGRFSLNDAFHFYKLLTENIEKNQDLKDKINIFIITNDNFDILYETKDLQSYQAFHSTYYQ